MRNKTTLLATAAMFAAIVFLFWQNDQRIFQDQGRLAVRPDPGDRDAVIFTWNSAIDVPMARRFEEAFDAWKGKTGRIVIELNSPGGSLSEGGRVVDVIEKMKRTHVVETRVGADGVCLSMCVPIYLRGARRVAAPSSRWMFHQPTTRDFFTDEKVDEPAFETRMTARRFFNRYFVHSEMDPAWRAKLERDWQGGDVWKTGQELVDEGANVVMALE